MKALVLAGGSGSRLRPKILVTGGAGFNRVALRAGAAFPRPAPRPAYSVLGHGAWACAGIEPIPGWRLRLHRGLRAVAGA